MTSSLSVSVSRGSWGQQAQEYQEQKQWSSSKDSHQGSKSSDSGEEAEKEFIFVWGHPCTNPTVQGGLLAIREEPRATPTSYAPFSWCFFLSLLFSLLFLKTETDPFLVNQSTFVWSSLKPWHLISKHSFICLQWMPASIPGPYLNFSEAATVCPAGWVFGGKHSNWKHLVQDHHSGDGGVLLHIPVSNLHLTQ